VKIENAFIYLIGIPAVGKYSTAKEIARLSGARVVDSQLVNMPIFYIVGYNGKDKPPIPPGSWAAIEKIRNSVFDFIRDHAPAGMSFVFTNVLNDSRGDRRIFRKIERIALHRGGAFVPVFLSCDAAEIRRRKRNADRRERLKDTDISNITYYTEEFRGLSLSHQHALYIDTTNSPQTQTAKQILKHTRSVSRL
jgi:shikimate kinase